MPKTMLLYNYLKIISQNYWSIALCLILIKCQITYSSILTYSVERDWILRQKSTAYQEPPHICKSLRNNFRFDSLFSQRITYYDGAKIYTPYLAVDGELYSLAQHDYYLGRVGIQPVHVAENPFFSKYKFDLAFVMPYPSMPEKTQFCTLRLMTLDLVCVQMIHYRSRNFETPLAYVGNVSVKIRLPADFLPSVVFQPVEFEEYANTEYAYVFIEQRAVKDNVTKKWYYQRRFQTYSFKNLNNIVNYTQSINLPEYLLKIPNTIEITGIYQVSKKPYKNGVTVVNAFNGVSHSSCRESDCSKLTNYEPYFAGCTSPRSWVAESERPIQMIDQVSKMLANPKREDFLDFVTESEAIAARDEFVRIHKHIFKWAAITSAGLLVLLVLAIFGCSLKESIMGPTFRPNERLPETVSFETIITNGTLCSPLLTTNGDKLSL